MPEYTKLFLFGQASYKTKGDEMIVDLFVLAEKAFGENGSNTIERTFHSIGVEKLPTKGANFFVAIEMQAEPNDTGKHLMKVTLFNPSNIPIFVFGRDFEVTSRIAQNRGHVSFFFEKGREMELREQGQHWFSLSVDGRELHRISLNITLIHPPIGKAN